MATGSYCPSNPIEIDSELFEVVGAGKYRLVNHHMSSVAMQKDFMWAWNGERTDMQAEL